MTAEAAAAGMDADRLQRIGEHLERNYIDPGKIAGCQVAVLRRGRPAYMRSFGLMDRERAKPMAEDAIFRIYSMTKPVTSVALMTLYERGFFQLDDPVSRFLPDWRNQRVWVSGRGEAMQVERPHKHVSVRHLLSHTGGLTYGVALEELGMPPGTNPVDEAYRQLGIGRSRDQTLAELSAKIGQTPLRYQPGERWMYSLSTDVCARLVEVISGQRFDRYLRETIFEPLGMADTGFFTPPEKLGRFAANYARRGDKSLALIDDPQRSIYAREPVFFSGGGGLVSTSADYLRFCEMLRLGGALDGARILGPRTIALMRRNHLIGGKDLKELAIAGFSETATPGVGFGLGFATTLDSVAAGGLGAGDFYWGGAASTLFWIDPAEALSVVFMTQLIPSGAFNFRGQLKAIVYSSIID